MNHIHCGDNLEYTGRLASDTINTIISSPPYNINKEYETSKSLSSYLEMQENILRQCFRALKCNGSIFWQVGSYIDGCRQIPLDVKLFPILEKLGAVPINRIIWTRPHWMNSKNKFSGRHETIMWFAKSEDYKFNLDSIRVPQKYKDKKYHKGDKHGQLSCNPMGKNPGDIWCFQSVKHNHEEQTSHPCQFPEDLVTRIILASTDAGDVVFDPYFGSGTVGVVASKHGRKWIGCDNSELYCDIARRRIDCSPDKNGSFANLKCLREYVSRTGEPISKYRFDEQTSCVATTAQQSKIHTEEHHLDELYCRLGLEEDSFSDRVNS